MKETYFTELNLHAQNLYLYLVLYTSIYKYILFTQFIAFQILDIYNP
jgi:hypothetical protein